MNSLPRGINKVFRFLSWNSPQISTNIEVQVIPPAAPTALTDSVACKVMTFLILTGTSVKGSNMLNLCVCRSYGCVFKAHYKETGEIVAIKQVPVESDLQEIIKEISIMQQCNRYK